MIYHGESSWRQGPRSELIFARSDEKHVAIVTGNSFRTYNSLHEPAKHDSIFHL